MKTLLNFIVYFAKRNTIVLALLATLAAMYSPLAFLPEEGIYLSENTVQTLFTIGKYSAGLFVVLTWFAMKSIWIDNMRAGFKAYLNENKN